LRGNGAQRDVKNAALPAFAPNLDAFAHNRIRSGGFAKALHKIEDSPADHKYSRHFLAPAMASNSIVFRSTSFSLCLAIDLPQAARSL
jgi:hypothetical protein